MRSSREYAAAFAACAVVLAGVITMAVVGHPSTPTTASVGPLGLGGAVTQTGPASSTATHQGVTVTLRLDRTQVSAGVTIHGTLVVTNRTKTEIRSRSPMICGRFFAYRVSLTDAIHPPDLGWEQPACHPGFGFEPGTSRYPIVVYTTGGNPFGPFMSGRYSADLVFDGFPVPVPLPIPITIVHARPAIFRQFRQ